MSDGLSVLLGALIGAAAAIGGVYLQARSAEKTQRAQREEDARQKHLAIARRYLYQLADALNSLQHRIDNWASQGGREFSETRFPDYWAPTTLYVFARALGAERILILDGVYVDLRDRASEMIALVPPRAVDTTVKQLFESEIFDYQRMTLAEAAIERGSNGLRLVTYSEFATRLNDPNWAPLLNPIRDALEGDVNPRRLGQLNKELVRLLGNVNRVIATEAYGRNNCFMGPRAARSLWRPQPGLRPGTDDCSATRGIAALVAAQTIAFLASDRSDG